MGSDLVPFIANLFVTHYEDMWIREKREVLRTDERFSVFCFIDDLPALNDDGKFDKASHEIYQNLS